MPFPRDQIASYAAALNPIPARLLLERRNVAGSQLRVVDFSKFRGKPVLILTGTNDLGHARAVDEPIADWLNANGAEADFIYLGRPRYHRQRPHADAGAQQRRPCAVDHRLDRVLAEGWGVRARESRMSDILIGVIVCGLVFGAAILGMFLGIICKFSSRR